MYGLYVIGVAIYFLDIFGFTALEVIMISRNDNDEVESFYSLI